MEKEKGEAGKDEYHTSSGMKGENNELGHLLPLRNLSPQAYPNKLTHLMAYGENHNCHQTSGSNPHRCETLHLFKCHLKSITQLTHSLTQSTFTYKTSENENLFLLKT